MLSDRAYTDGHARLRQAVAEAAAGEEEIIIPVDIKLEMALGQAA